MLGLACCLLSVAVATPALGQGVIAPRPVDVAPPPRPAPPPAAPSPTVVPPPPPTVTAPTPTPRASVVVPTVQPPPPAIPAPQGTTRSTSGPSRWSSSTPLPGVNATLLDSSGRNVGRAVSDGNGLLSFDRLPQGKYDLVIPGTGGAQPQQRVLIGLLMPAVQKFRTLSLPGGGAKKLTLEVGPTGEATRLEWQDGGITAMDDWEAPHKFGGTLPPGVGTTRIALALDGGSVPDGRVSVPNSSGGRSTTSSSIFDRWGNLLPGVGVSWTGPGGPRTAVSDANGAVPLGRLPGGVHEFTVSTRSTGGTGGTQPQMILVGLLLPAVQSVREAKAIETVVPANSGDRRVRLGVNSRGEVTSLDWGDGKGPVAINVAVGDVNGDGREDLATGRRQYQPLLRSARDQTHLVFGVASGPGTASGPQNAPVATSSNKKHGLPSVGVSASGPGGVMQLQTDGEGVARLGRLPIGSTTVELDGNQLRSTVSSAGPGKPGQPAGIVGGFLIPAIAILAVRSDGQPTVSFVKLPANAIPAKVRAIVRVGRDGNVMDVDWGNGPQAVQVAGVLAGTVSGPAGPIAGALAGAKPGDVVVALEEANNILMDVSTTR